MVATVSVTAQEYYPESAEEQDAAEFIPVEQDDAADDSLVRVRRAPHRGGIY